MSLSFTCRCIELYLLVPVFGRRSKAELIRCETHGAFKQTDMVKRGRDDEKKREIADKGGAVWIKLETCAFNMSNLAECILSSGERRWPPAVEDRIRASRRCLILMLSFSRSVSLSVALMYNWCVLGTLSHWSTEVFIYSQVGLGSTGTIFKSPNLKILS